MTSGISEGLPTSVRGTEDGPLLAGVSGRDSCPNAAKGHAMSSPMAPQSHTNPHMELPRTSFTINHPRGKFSVPVRRHTSALIHQRDLLREFKLDERTDFIFDLDIPRRLGRRQHLADLLRVVALQLDFLLLN